MDEEVLKIAVAVLAILLAIILIGVLPFLLSRYKRKLQQKQHDEAISLLTHQAELKERELLIEKMQGEINIRAKGQADVFFENWKNVEMDGQRKIIESASFETHQAMLQRWILEYEKTIRQDASKRSVSIVLGKVTEHLVPFSEAFKNFNPKDARFLGSPIDLIVFDGVEEKKDKLMIWFVEVKTGTSALNSTQKRIREAVKDKRVDWMEVSMRDLKDDLSAEAVKEA